MVATEEEVDLGRAGTDGFWWDVQRLSYCFYVDDGILASPRATYLHRAFESLTELFYHMGLHTNVANTARMDCYLCSACVSLYR